MYVGKSIKRVDAYAKATGKAKFTEDLCPADALVVKLLHATIPHGYVKSIDHSEADKMPGVVRVFTCFDVPKHTFPTDGHPWNLEGGHPNLDRNLLATHVRHIGEEIAAVVAEDEVTAKQALATIKVEYEELPFYLHPKDSYEEGAAQIFDDKPRNKCGESHYGYGDYEEVIKEEGLLEFRDELQTPVVQHCHIENHVCYAYQDGGKITVVTTTQSPHVARRIIGQALGTGCGDIRVIKPYVGGGFGNKVEVVYEALCAWLTTQLGGRCVRIFNTREETFANSRVRQQYDVEVVTHVRKDGTVVARYLDLWNRKGAYTSHGHGVVEASVGFFMNMYPCQAIKTNAYSIYTNTPPGGAMRGYGCPQVMFFVDAHMENIARRMGVDSVEFKLKNAMKVGYRFELTNSEVYENGLEQCVEKGLEHFKYREKQKLYANQTGPVRRGVGMAIFYYTTAVWPYYVETDTCRMSLNQDGSVQVQLADVEIGQGADTVFTQIAADILGFPMEKIHVVSTQDTDVTPFGTGAYGSRQTYVSSFSIRATGEILKSKILEKAHEMEQVPVEDLEIADGEVVSKKDGSLVISMHDLAVRSLYNISDSEFFFAEKTTTVTTNAFNYGCVFAEVEVDIPMCRVRLLNMLNVHDSGKIVNPATAEAQVHGGMSMAMGYGMYEELLFDEKTGEMLNGNLLDYKMPTIMDHPRLSADFVETSEPTSYFGNRALGEPPTVSGAPAIRNAICDATGVEINRIPITPKVLFEEFKKAGLI